MSLRCFGPSFKFCSQLPVFFVPFFPPILHPLDTHFCLQNSHLLSLIIDLHLHPSATSCNCQPPQHLSHTTILARAAILMSNLHPRNREAALNLLNCSNKSFNFTSNRFSGIKVGSRLPLFSNYFGLPSQSPRKQICLSADLGFGKRICLPSTVRSPESLLWQLLVSRSWVLAS
jgi:hypothetical protein